MRLKERIASYRSDQCHSSDVPDITASVTRHEVDFALNVAVSKHGVDVEEKRRKMVLIFWK